MSLGGICNPHDHLLQGKAEKHRLHTYVTTTVLDKSWWSTTKQFVLHFNEQLRQLDEVSPTEESLPYSTRLTLLQTAVHNIPELRMVETMKEFTSLSSTTPGPTMGYDNYLNLLQNMIAVKPLGPLQPLELPTNMTCLLTIMNTSITLPQAPHMVALTCQQRNSTRFILQTSIGLLLSPPLPLGNLSIPLLLADPPTEGLREPMVALLAQMI